MGFKLSLNICIFIGFAVLSASEDAKKSKNFFLPPHHLIIVKTDHYILPVIPFEFEELEPYIDEATVKAHLFGHHNAYKEKMNTALKEWRAEEPDNEFAKDSILNIMKDLDKVPEKFRTRVRNMGGGFVNHCFYWSVMVGNDDKEDRRPTGKLLDDINAAFGSFDEFKKQWNTTALGIFGSGYVWLTRKPGADAPNLAITTTANQDSPVSDGLQPILVQDMWEHAWYLKHNYNKAAHLQDWWMVVSWEQVDKLDQWWGKVNSGEFERIEAEKLKEWERRRAEKLKKKEEEEKKSEL